MFPRMLPNAQTHRIGDKSIPQEWKIESTLPKRKRSKKLDSVSNSSKISTAPTPPNASGEIFNDVDDPDMDKYRKKYKQMHEDEAKQYLNLASKGDLCNMYQLLPPAKSVLPPPPASIALKLKDPFQMCVVGMTGSGKTNFVYNIYKTYGCFDRVFLLAKDTEEHLYEEFVKSLKEEGKRTGRDIIKVSNNLKDFPDITALNKRNREKKERTLLIIDDMINEKAKDLKDIINAWTLGRKGMIYPVWIGQSYFQTPIMIRKNSSIIALGRLASEKDMKRIVAEQPQLSLDHKEIGNLYKKIQMTYGDMNFLLVDTNSNEAGLQFRHNLAPYSIFPQGYNPSKINNHNSNSSSPNPLPSTNKKRKQPSFEDIHSQLHNEDIQ